MALNTVRKRKVEIPRHSHRRRQQKEQAPAETPRTFSAETVAVLLAATGVFVAVALTSHFHQLAQARAGLVADIPEGQNVMGPVGAVAARTLDGLLGWCSYVVVIWALLLSSTIWMKGWPAGNSSVRSLVCSGIGSVLMAAASAAIFCLFFGFDGGGRIGSRIAFTLVQYVNEPGTLLVCAAIFLLSFGFATEFGVSRLFHSLRVFFRFLRSLASESFHFIVGTSHAVISGELFVGRAILLAIGAIARFVFRAVVAVTLAPIRLVTRPFRRGARCAVRQERDAESDDDRFVLGDTLSVRERPARGKPKEKPLRRALGKVRISRGTRGSARESRGRERLKALAQSRRLKRQKRREQSSTNEAGPHVNGKGFELPPPDLLVSGDTQKLAGPKDEDLIRNSAIVERTLADFNITGKVVEAHPGPVITLYEFEPAAGVKVQRIVNLADDLALGLKVASVRVYAPVPGKGTVGIEVPNSEREIVRLRDILDSREMGDAESGIALALGKDTFGQPYVADLARMPHLLIAGATGTGKSVCINSLILSLLCRNSPETLRFLMIDPKMLELSIYEGIPHLKAPVVTNPKHARGVLWWAVEEMERRYRLMKALGVRHFLNYNSLVGAERGDVARRARSRTKLETIELREMDVVATSSEQPRVERDLMPDPLTHLSGGERHERLPRIVIVVDELADLMLTVGREIEELLTRLAQKARAAGIHLILATQRPSVNVITGLIKANFPARISFQVASRIDARTVLDSSGAEKLLGQGDMLFLNPSRAGIKRLHSAFVSDREVQDVVEFVRSQGEPDYDTEIEQMVKRLEENEKGVGVEGVEGETDPLYDQAVSIIVEKGHASTSMIQRVFRIGYNRAARILEMMEREGVVGPADGAKPRQVLVPNRDLL